MERLSGSSQLYSIFTMLSFISEVYKVMVSGVVYGCFGLTTTTLHFEIAFCFRLKFYYKVKLCKIQSITWLLAHAMKCLLFILRGSTWV